ncbi:MAG: acyl-CoA dehydrogenase family protein [Chloroflexota bacterium]
MEIPLNIAEEELVAMAQTFAQEVVLPQAASWEAARTFPRAAFSQAAELGLCRLLVSPADGGHGIRLTAMARIMEELAAASMPFAFSLTVHNNLAANIANNGSPEQRETYLPSLLSGESVGAFLLTEPQGGSDAAVVRTSAQLDGDEWVLAGQKDWVSNGAVAKLLSIYAQTNPELGWRGIACFLVDAAQSGVVRLPAYQLLGGHVLGTGAFRFEGCRVEKEAMLLGPGEAFKAAMQGIDLARILVAAMCCGMMRTGLEEALAATAVRHSFGRPIGDYQAIQWMLADTATDLKAARLLTYDAATLWDVGKEATLAAAHAKKFATRVALTRLSDCMQCMGAPGLRIDNTVARHFAAAKMAQYLDGSTEIQNIVISRKLRSQS